MNSQQSATNLEQRAWGLRSYSSVSSYEGHFLRSRQEAAPEVVRFLATQVGVDAPLFVQYTWEGRTIEAHRAQIREITKIREFRHADEEALLDWLCTDIFDHEYHPERLRDLIRTECRTRAIDAPDDITVLIETGLVIALKSEHLLTSRVSICLEG